MAKNFATSFFRENKCQYSGIYVFKGIYNVYISCCIPKTPLNIILRPMEPP